MRFAQTYKDTVATMTPESARDNIEVMLLEYVSNHAVEHYFSYYAVAFLYQVVMIWLWGSTIGKWICGIRVVRLDQRKVPLVSSIVR